MYSYQCILRLLAFIRLLVVCSRILPVCIRMLPVCYPYVFPSYWYSYLPECIRVLLVYYPYVTLVYLCGVFSQDPGKRLQTEVKKITHIILLSFTTIHLLFFIKRKKTELAIYWREEKWGHELPTDRAKIF